MYSGGCVLLGPSQSLPGLASKGEKCVASLTRSARHVRVNRQRQDESVLLLAVQVREMVLPFLLDHLRRDEAVRVRRVLDKHHRRQVVQLQLQRRGIGQTRRLHSHPNWPGSPPYPWSRPASAAPSSSWLTGCSRSSSSYRPSAASRAASRGGGRSGLRVSDLHSSRPFSVTSPVVGQLIDRPAHHR